MRNPTNWDDEIRPKALKASNYRCSKCQVPNGMEVFWMDGGQWVEADELAKKYEAKKGVKPSKIVLSIMRVNGLQWDCRPANLKAFCQRHKGVLEGKWLMENKRLRRVHDVDKLAAELNQREKPYFLSTCFARLVAYRNNIHHMQMIAEKRRGKGFNSAWDRAYNRTILRLQREYTTLAEALADSIFPEVESGQRFIEFYLLDPYSFFTGQV